MTIKGRQNFSGEKDVLIMTAVTRIYTRAKIYRNVYKNKRLILLYIDILKLAAITILKLGSIS